MGQRAASRNDDRPGNLFLANLRLVFSGIPTSYVGVADVLSTSAFPPITLTLLLSQKACIEIYGTKCGVLMLLIFTQL